MIMHLCLLRRNRFPSHPFSFLLVILIAPSIHSQLCQENPKSLPGDYICDNTLHIYHHDHDLMKKYCGNKIGNRNENTAKLTNARNADLFELPFMGSLVWGGKHQCGAVLIDNIHIITAAHCIVPRAAYDVQIFPEDLTVVLGTNIRYKNSLRDPNAVVNEVDEFAIHPSYRQEEFNEFGPFTGNDIAILKLSEPVKFSPTIWPVCVGSSSAVLGHANPNPVVLSGYGSDGLRHKPVLQRSDKLTLLSEDECYKNLKEQSQRDFQDSQMCTLPSDPLTGKQIDKKIRI